MRDVWEEHLICSKCNKKTDKIIINRENFNIRTWKCKQCRKYWPHPLDNKKFEEWKKVKNLTFKVKIREVGNSAVVSMPKEILNFKECLGKNAVWKFNNSDELILKFTP